MAFDIYTASVKKTFPFVTRIDATGVGNVGAGADDLITYTLPANTISVNGQALRMMAWGTCANNINAKTLTGNIGAVTVVSTAMAVSVAHTWLLECYVVRTGATTADVFGRTISSNTEQDHEVAAGVTVDWSTALVIKCTGTGTANDDLRQEGMVVEVLGV